MEQLKKGDLVDITIEKVEGKGKSIARIGQLVVFADKGIPGQKVRAKIVKIKKKFLQTTVQETLEKAPDEIAATCPYFGVCGGCSWQNMPYESQLKIKHTIVSDALRHLGGIDAEAVLEPQVVPSPTQWFYRNKIELSFGKTDDQPLDLGFRQKGVYSGVIPIESCEIFDEIFPKVIIGIRKWVHQVSEYGFFNPRKSPDGFFQYLMIRKSEATGEWMLNIITQEGMIPLLDVFLDTLKSTLGDKLACVIQTVNQGSVGYAHHNNKYTRLLHGKETIMEKLGDLSFELSPFSFFQTNTQGAVKLYDVIKAFANPKSGERILDLYCGTGSIGQYIAKGTDAQIYGIEIVPEAIENARANAIRNNIDNVTYFCGPSKTLLKVYNELWAKLNTLIIDPPRAGMDKSTIKSILKMPVQKFIYVSCNPATFSRDVALIHEESDFKLTKLQPVDMFPHTSHVELVGMFEKK
jgi:23S rRNA (uracil1939-C5)-methyltransferase